MVREGGRGELERVENEQIALCVESNVLPE